MVIGFVRKHVTDPVIDTATQLPDAVRGVRRGRGDPRLRRDQRGRRRLLLGHKSPILQTAQSRIAERMNWRSIAFLLESSVFLLIGLQARSDHRDAFGGEVTDRPDRRGLRLARSSP